MKLKFWTVQNKKVPKIIDKKGEYYPDFKKSDYLKKMPEMEELYDFLLTSYNEANGMDLSGVVYAFTYVDDMTIQSFDDYDEFKGFVESRADAVSSIWDDIVRKDAVVMELEYELDFNPIAFDINDWQALMPPQVCEPPYLPDVFDEIEENIASGVSFVSRKPSYLMQAHLPYIKKENLLNVYPAFSLEK